MAKGIDLKSNPVLVELIQSLKAAGRENRAPIWRDIASRLERPSRNWAQVNVSKLEQHVRDGEHVVVPGKLLGSGDLAKAYTVIAFSASAAAKAKVTQAGGTVLTLNEGVAQFPKGEKCRIRRVNQMVTIIDASGLVLGRLATNVAKRALGGEEVHIVNAEKAIISGSKKAIQARYKFKREVGTHRKGPFFPREPHLIVKRTVRGMMDYQSPSGRDAYQRIKAHIGVPKELAGQETISVADAQREPRTFQTIAQLSTYLGRPTEA